VNKVSAMLLLYAILVIASSIFWVRYAVSKSRLTVGGNTPNVSRATDAKKMKKNARMTMNNATELTGGVTDDDKADGQANDIVKSNDL
jgi:hypothetical protein